MKTRIIYALITLGLICHIVLNVDMDAVATDTPITPNDFHSILFETQFGRSALMIQSRADVDFVPATSVSIIYILTEEQLEQYIQENKIPPETREFFGEALAKVINYHDEYGDIFRQIPLAAFIAGGFPYDPIKFVENGGTIEYNILFLGPWRGIYENFGGL